MDGNREGEMFGWRGGERDGLIKREKWMNGEGEMDEWRGGDGWIKGADGWIKRERDGWRGRDR